MKILKKYHTVYNISFNKPNQLILFIIIIIMVYIIIIFVLLCRKTKCGSGMQSAPSRIAIRLVFLVVGIFIEILLVFYTWIFDLFEDTYIYITFLQISSIVLRVNFIYFIFIFYFHRFFVWYQKHILTNLLVNILNI